MLTSWENPRGKNVGKMKKTYLQNDDTPPKKKTNTSLFSEDFVGVIFLKIMVNPPSKKKILFSTKGGDEKLGNELVNKNLRRPVDLLWSIHRDQLWWWTHRRRRL